MAMRMRRIFVMGSGDVPDPTSALRIETGTTDQGRFGRVPTGPRFMQATDISATRAKRNPGAWMANVLLIF